MMHREQFRQVGLLCFLYLLFFCPSHLVSQIAGAEEPPSSNLDLVQPDSETLTRELLLNKRRYHRYGQSAQERGRSTQRRKVGRACVAGRQELSRCGVDGGRESGT